MEVVADLSDSASYDYRALDNGGCGATITATFTIGSWSDSAPRSTLSASSLTVTPSLYPTCGDSPVTTLYTPAACSAVRQRVQYVAAYTLESDEDGFMMSGDVDLAHSDVTITRTNLDQPCIIHQGTSAAHRPFRSALWRERIGRRHL